MYNINNHYNYILQYANTKSQNVKLGYFFPFGSTNFNNLEFLGSMNNSIYMLCYDQEPLNYNYNTHMLNQFDNLTTYTHVQKKFNFYSNYLENVISLENQNILQNKKIPTILLNTEKDSLEKNKILDQYGFIDCYYFFHALAAADWYRGYQYSSEITPIQQRKITKKFITYNRITGNSRVYRALFVASLAKKNLLEDGHVSFSKQCPVHNNIESSILNVIKDFNLDKNYIHKELKYISTIPDLRIDSATGQPIENSSFSIGDILKPMESFVNVVTETCFWETKKHLTEKIFKPIVLKQPFILLGCADNLSYLKDYGFKTFDRWWDESYDQCQDPIQRINMVTKILEDLCKLPNDKIQDMLLEMEEILEYNYSLFYSQKFINSIWDELKINLNTAIAQASLLTFQETLDQNHLCIAENKSLV
jgi:hypothetical protein